MPVTEAYKEHVIYTFHAFCKVVIRNAAMTAWRNRSRQRQREISANFLVKNKYQERVCFLMVDFVSESIIPFH